ncbi:hypothetical protein AALO_G00146040, partial [Alosa alosa]
PRVGFCRDSPRSSLNNSLSDQSLASVNLNSYTPVSTHAEAVSQVSQPLPLQQAPQPQYSIPERDKQLLFSDFEDLSASFRSLYKSVFEQSFSQQGLMGMPSDSSTQQTHTSCSYQHSPSSSTHSHTHTHAHTHSHTHSGQNNTTNSHPNSIPTSGSQMPLSHSPHPAHGSPHTHTHPQHLPPHAQHGGHATHTQHTQHSQHTHTPHTHAHTHAHTALSAQHGQQHQQQLVHQSHATQQQMPCSNAGLLSDWYPSLDALKESCRIASSYNWADVDLSPFQGLKESMRQAELNNWSLEPTQIADLCSSINQFFTRTGVIPPQGAVPPAVCHGAMHPNKPSQHINTGNMYMDSRQTMSSMMGPPGYPHMPPMSSAGPTMTPHGHHPQMNQQHMMPPGNFQMRQMPADDIQDDFDWDSIV